MQRMAVLCVLVALMLSGSAFGAYKETFTGGFDLGTNPMTGGWACQGLDANNAPIAGGFTNDTSGNYLRIQAPFPPAGMGGTGAARVVEVVPSQTGTDFYMSALFNPNQLAYPDVINDSCIALLARANLATGTGYAVHFQRGWSGIGIIKLDPALPGGYANIGTGVAVPDLAQAYNIDVRVAGSTIAYNLYNSAGTFIGGDSVVDTDITGARILRRTLISQSEPEPGYSRHLYTQPVLSLSDRDEHDRR